MEMTREEKITKLCEKVMVTREEADAALAANNDDILDAVLYLESLGRIRTPRTATYVEDMQEESYSEEPVRKHKSESFGEAVGRFCAWIVKLVKAGCENYLDIAKDGETKARIPLIVPALLLIPCFWLEAILLIVGLCFGCQYSFSGPAFKKDGKANQFARKASESTEQFREQFNRGFQTESSKGFQNEDNIE